MSKRPNRSAVQIREHPFAGGQKLRPGNPIDESVDAAIPGQVDPAEEIPSEEEQRSDRPQLDNGDVEIPEFADEFTSVQYEDESREYVENKHVISTTIYRLKNPTLGVHYSVIDELFQIYGLVRADYFQDAFYTFNDHIYMKYKKRLFGDEMYINEQIGECLDVIYVNLQYLYGRQVGNAHLDLLALSDFELSVWKDEGLVKGPLTKLLNDWGVPAYMHREVAEKLESEAKALVGAALRPKWDERGKYAELKDLSSPAFLKRVYAEAISADGTIQKDAVRKIDPKLMAAVETYISAREGRRRDMGDAEGLRLITGPHTRPKRATLG